MVKPKSGGARATERKRRNEAAVRGENYDADSASTYAKIKRGKDSAAILGEAVEHLRTAMREAAADQAIPATTRREQVGRLAAMLAKAVDPKRQIDELGADLRLASSVIENIREGNAPHLSSGDPSRATPQRLS